MLDSKTIVSMMADFGIHENDGHILKHLLEFNHKCISLILEEAKSCARLANKDKIDINDIQLAVLKAMDGAIPRFSSQSNTGEEVEIIEISDTESINEESYHRILARIDKKPDDILPEITDLDIEEVIGNTNDDQDIIPYKFNVDSLLNDPHLL